MKTGKSLKVEYVGDIGYLRLCFPTGICLILCRIRWNSIPIDQLHRMVSGKMGNIFQFRLRMGNELYSDKINIL
jgi:hypothetical protein